MRQARRAPGAGAEKDEAWALKYARLLYLTFPAQWLVSILTDWNLRAVFLQGLPRLNALYYWFFFAVGIVLRLKPRWTAALSLPEHLLNFTLLVVSVWSRIYDPGLLAGESLERATPPITMSLVLNFMVTGGLLVALIQSEIGKLERRVRGEG